MLSNQLREPTLRDRFFGCIAGCHIGSAMGAAVENLSHSQIEQKYGFVEDFLPYEHYENGWMREPGTTEDGVERQKLLIYAILEKQNRINAEDVRKAWINHMNPNAGGTVSEPFEGVLLQLAKSGIPARDIGRYCDYAGLNSFARACHPIGLINAGSPETAVEDILEVGQLYQTSNSRGLKWACVTGVAIAAGTTPGASVDKVLGAIYDLCDPEVVREIDRELRNTAGIHDIRALRQYFDGVYSGVGIPYPFSYANEVVTKGVVIFRMTKGDVRESILAGVNMGRDTDCVAAVAGGIAGALSGGEALPQKWITQLDRATGLNPHTCSQRTLRETTDALYDAFRMRLCKEAAYIAQMENA